MEATTLAIGWFPYGSVVRFRSTARPISHRARTHTWAPSVMIDPTRVIKAIEALYSSTVMEIHLPPPLSHCPFFGKRHVSVTGLVFESLFYVALYYTNDVFDQKLNDIFTSDDSTRIRVS